MAQRDALLTVAGVARLAGISRQTIYEWLASGDIPPRVKFGRRWLFRRADVLTWLKAQEGRR